MTSLASGFLTTNFKRYAHAAGPFNYSISRGPVLVSAGQAHPTARRARSCGNTSQLPSCAYPRPGRPAHMHGGIRTSVQSQPVIATEAQGHRHSQWPSRTAPVHNASEPPRRWKERPGIKPRLKRQDAPAAGVPAPAHAAARGSAHSRTIETNQHSFNYDFPCALSYVRAIMNGFMFHICAGRTYTIIVTSHSKMSLPLSTVLQKR